MLSPTERLFHVLYTSCIDQHNGTPWAETQRGKNTLKSEETSPNDQSDQVAGMTPEQLAEAKQYGHLDLTCMLADKALDVAFLTTAAFLLAQPLNDWLCGYPLLESCWSLRLVCLYVVVYAMHVCVSFPLSFYSSHILEHRFSLSNLSLRGWLWRYFKNNALSVIFGTAVMLGLYWIIWTTGVYWWLVAAGAFFVVSVLLGQLAPVLIMPLFNKIEPLEDSQLAGELTERLRRLSEGTGLSIEGVYKILLSEETVKVNAMLAGLGRTRRVLLSDTLLDEFSPDEIEVIFAHEIGHHVFGHVRKLIAAGVVFSLGGFFVCDQLLQVFVGGWNGDYAVFPVYALPMLILLITLLGQLTEPLTNALCRRFERQSDNYALQRTGLDEAFTSAFQKAAIVNKDDPDPHWLDALLFHDHPPIAQRLATTRREQ
jgi:STE24 endopeptidase